MERYLDKYDDLDSFKILYYKQDNVKVIKIICVKKDNNPWVITIKGGKNSNYSFNYIGRWNKNLVFSAIENHINNNKAKLAIFDRIFEGEQ